MPLRTQAKSTVSTVSQPDSRSGKGSTVQRLHDRSIEICILAGGESKRMGRDKSRLRLGARTMLGHIRKTALTTGLPVRVIRRDCVLKCGPLGGIYTALKTTKAKAVLFVACDMPLVSAELIQFVLRQSTKRPDQRGTLSRLESVSHPLFVRSRGRAGFPFTLPRSTLATVTERIKACDFSLQNLAKTLRATILPLTNAWSRQLFNVNTPADCATIATCWKSQNRLRRGRGIAS